MANFTSTGSDTFPAGMIINTSVVKLASDGNRSNSTTPLVVFSPTYTPSKNNSIIHAHLCIHFTSVSITGTNDNRKQITYVCTGDDITNITFSGGWTLGQWGDWHGRTGHHLCYLVCSPRTVDGTGTAALTYAFSGANEAGDTGSNFTVHGDNSLETMITFFEEAV